MEWVSPSNRACGRCGAVGGRPWTNREDDDDDDAVVLVVAVVVLHGPLAPNEISDFMWTRASLRIEMAFSSWPPDISNVTPSRFILSAAAVLQQPPPIVGALEAEQPQPGPRSSSLS